MKRGCRGLRPLRVRCSSPRLLRVSARVLASNDGEIDEHRTPPHSKISCVINPTHSKSMGISSLVNRFTNIATKNATKGVGTEVRWIRCALSGDAELRCIKLHSPLPSWDFGRVPPHIFTLIAQLVEHRLPTTEGRRFESYEGCKNAL